jgi:CSLREA domain-containing protein
MYYLVRVGFVFTLLIASLGIRPTQTVHAANITVNTIDDEDNSDGDCSLREAIYAANNDTTRDGCNTGSGDDVIDLTGVVGTIILGGSELAINSKLTIQGPGADLLSISGNHVSRVFNVAPGVVATISDITIANGNSTGDDGGGILNNNGWLFVNRCTFLSNQTQCSGGGIGNYGILTVDKSTFHDNQAELNGGAINNEEGTVNVNNSTFSGNRASEGSFDNYGGGGICNMAEMSPAQLTINNTTITNNSAMWGGGISNFDGTLKVKNTIVADNTVHTGGAGPNCHNSTGIASSYNLESGTDCGFTGTGDMQNTEAKLGPLQDNGGSTWTRALLVNSPAINAGSCIDLNENPVTTDQRGMSRLGPCDIGAYEFVLMNYLPLVKRD